MSPDATFRDFYREDARALHYRDKHDRDRTHRRAHRAESAAIADLLRRAGEPDGPWLDLPSGTGRFEPVLEAQGFQYVAADASHEMLRLAAERAHDDGARGWTGAVQASAFALPFEAGSFDGAMCLRFLHHFSSGTDRVRALAAVRRVVRRSAIVSFFAKESLQATRRRLRVRLRGHTTGRHAQSVASFREECRRAGFRVEALRYRDRFVSEWAVALLRVDSTTDQ